MFWLWVGLAAKQMWKFNRALMVNVASFGGLLGTDFMLLGESDGIASDFTVSSGAGEVTVKDVATPGNAKARVAADAFWGNAGTSPKLVTGSDGVLKWSPHNLFLNSAAPATQNVTLIVGATYTVTVTGAGGGSLTGSAGAAGVATTGSPLTFVASTTTGTFTYAATLTTIQINRGSVATAYLATTAAIKIGLAIDYANNSYGLLVEPASTNLALYASDFTNAAWTKLNMTTAFTSIGPDGISANATRLTATAGNATALQAITSGSAARATSVYLKRITGTGNVEVTQDNGGTWVNSGVTSSWTRFNINPVTSANPTVGIRIVTSGDAVDVALFQNEVIVSINFPVMVSSPIPTFDVTVTRAADLVKALTATFPYSAVASTLFLQNIIPNINVGANVGEVSINDGTSTNRVEWFSGTSGVVGWRVAGGAAGVSANGSAAHVAGAVTKTAAGLSTNDYAAYQGGVSVLTDATANLPSSVTQFQLGGTSGSATSGCPHWIQKVKYLPRRMTDPQLAVETT